MPKGLDFNTIVFNLPSPWGCGLCIWRFIEGFCTSWPRLDWGRSRFSLCGGSWNRSWCDCWWWWWRRQGWGWCETVHITMTTRWFARWCLLWWGSCRLGGMSWWHFLRSGWCITMAWWYLLCNKTTELLTIIIHHKTTKTLRQNASVLQRKKQWWQRPMK